MEFEQLHRELINAQEENNLKNIGKYSFELSDYYYEQDDYSNMIKYMLIAIKSDKTYYTYIENMFDNLEAINNDIMAEFVDIIKKNKINKSYYERAMKDYLYTLSFQEQTYYYEQLGIETNRFADVKLKLENFSKDTKCINCLEELICVPVDWHGDYKCVECMVNCTAQKLKK